MKTFAIAALGLLILNAHVQAQSLRLSKTIPLPGVKGRFDHFAIDEENKRLFVAALGNDSAEVIDLAAGKHLKSITGLHKPTGLIYLAESNRLGAANGDDGNFKLFDGASFQQVNNLTGLDDADNVQRDPKTRNIYVGNGDGAIAILDPSGTKHLGDIKLAAHPESFQLEPNGPRMFVNVPDAGHIAVLDRDAKRVIATWPMKQFRANFPMALDAADHRLFIGCRQPARLVVLDADSGKPVSDLALSGDIDDLFYDARRHRLYASCGEGFVDVISQRNPDSYERTEKIPTRTGARTCWFSSQRDELYLAVPRANNHDAELRVYVEEQQN